MEELHGTAVPDPYRWLEDAEDPEVAAWTAAQNAFTDGALADSPGRDRLRARLAELLAVGSLTAPVVRPLPDGGWRLFYQRREAGQDQPVLLRRDGPEGPDCLLLDPAVYEPDATSALDWWYPSPDGRLLAYGISRHGDEKSSLGIRDVETGRDLEDRIPNTRYSSVAWLPDGSGFYYTRYPEPGSVPDGDENYWRRVFFHALGADWREDADVFGGSAREDMPGVALSPDGRWLCVTVHQGWARSEVYLLDRARPGAGFVPVAAGEAALFLPEIQDDALYLRTNLDAPNYRIFRVDPERPPREGWMEIVPEGPDVLDGHAIVGRRLVCDVLRNACSALKVYETSGALAYEVDLPGPGSLIGLDGHPAGEDLYFAFVSFTTPPAVFRHHLANRTTTPWQQVPAPEAPCDFEVRQVRYPSPDGTPVPMFLVHRRGLPRDGNRPALLYGYGGFNVSVTPTFSRAAYLMAERDGVYAVANLRGGGEYGEAWHRDGMLERKQNVFDDFIAAAEYLIREGYTRPERLAIQGGSNGGLLVGAAVTQRPGLFAAAVCHVPLLDMVRYHLFRIARLWIAEYGSAEDPEQFRTLLAYSPYHRIREGERYPAMLITAAESDTRVDPLHARKFAAALQHATTGDGQVLLRLESRAGHGAGKPISKVLEESVDVWSFLLRELRMQA